MKPAAVVVIDDPTPYRNRHLQRKDNPGKKSKFGIGVAGRYSLGVMTEKAMTALGPLIQEVCCADAYVFSWATRPNLDMALRILQGRGLEYKTAPFTWVKTYPNEGLFKGPGRYTFSNPEDVLLGRWPESTCWHPNTGYKPASVIMAPHPRQAGKIIQSRKPEEVQDEIDRWLRPYAGEFTFLELFATRPREGWVCLGYDVTGRTIEEDLKDMAMQIELEGLGE